MLLPPAVEPVSAYAMRSSVRCHHLHAIPYDPQKLVVVIASCDGKDDFMTLKDDSIWAMNTQYIVYDKCNFCRRIPEVLRSNSIYARPLANLGREQATFLYFVILFYYNLPNEVIFMAGNFSKHNRLEHLSKLIRDPNHRAKCGPILDEHRDFRIAEYEGVQLYPASIRPFGAWFEANVGFWQNGRPGPCWNGMMRTTRERLLRHPIEFYTNLYRQSIASTNTEVGHYLERSMDAVF